MANGYCLDHTYGQGMELDIHIHRDRYGNFHSQILAILHNQEKKCD